MREVRSRCPRCGRVSFLPADAWSGVTDATLDEPCPGGCPGLLSRSPLGAVLVLLAVVVVPVVGVVLALGH